MKSWRWWILRAGAVMMGLAIGLITAEVMVRVFGPQRMVTKRVLVDFDVPRHLFDCYDSNPNGEFGPLPDTSRGNWGLFRLTMEPEKMGMWRLRETPWCVEYRVSSQKLRDREFSPEPPPGVVRIVGMGDSFSYGEGVPLEKSLFKQLEKELGPGFEVVNAADPGLDTALELDKLRDVSAALHCREAIVVFLLNDIAPTAALKRRENHLTDLVNVRDAYLYDRSSIRLLSLWHQGPDLEEVRSQTIQWYRDLYDPAQNAAGLAALRGHFEAMANLPDCRVSLVLYPLMEGHARGYPFKDIHARVARMAREAGLKVLDLTPVFAGMDERELQVHATDHHPNGRAHGLAAEGIAGWWRKIRLGAW